MICWLPLTLGFLLPAVLLLRLALTQGDNDFGLRYGVLAGNSLLVAGITAALAVALAVLLVYARRLGPSPIVRAVNRLVALGYAVPGSVIAVGVLIPVTRLDHWLAARWFDWFDTNPGLILTGGVAALIYAYLARFLSISLQTVESGLARVTPNMEAAARSLGVGGPALFFRVYLPLLVPGALSAALLVFVDVLKEMPATLLMRPFGWDTLSVRIFEMTSEGEWARAALPALTLVLVGLLPVIGLIRRSARQPGH